MSFALIRENKKKGGGWISRIVYNKMVAGSPGKSASLRGVYHTNKTCTHGGGVAEMRVHITMEALKTAGFTKCRFCNSKPKTIKAKPEIESKCETFPIHINVWKCSDGSIHDTEIAACRNELSLRGV